MLLSPLTSYCICLLVSTPDPGSSGSCCFASASTLGLEIDTSFELLIMSLSLRLVLLDDAIAVVVSVCLSTGRRMGLASGELLKEPRQYIQFVVCQKEFSMIMVVRIDDFRGLDEISVIPEVCDSRRSGLDLCSCLIFPPANVWTRRITSLCREMHIKVRKLRDSA